MKSPVVLALSAILFVSTMAIAAELERTENTNAYIGRCKSMAVERVVDIRQKALLEPAQTSLRPVTFEVVAAPFDNAYITRLSRMVDNVNKIGFDAARGMYHYENVDAQRERLVDTDDLALTKLRTKADQLVGELLGAEAPRFVFANTETDYVLEKGQSVPAVSRKTYRYTREVNGRHIVDNTAFIRVSFSGKSVLSGFEIVNPVLKPVGAVNRLVKLSAADSRLADYALNKRTARRNKDEGDELVDVVRIKATYGTDTYLSRSIGGRKLILPNQSFYAEFMLDNGESINDWIHLCVDADQTPNLSDDMIENIAR